MSTKAKTSKTSISVKARGLVWKSASRQERKEARDEASPPRMGRCLITDALVKRSDALRSAVDQAVANRSVTGLEGTHRTRPDKRGVGRTM
ncbi:MAG: hypothetical protein L7W43_12260 [Rubripirellula sp.]|nr:hypothetical protein [Rubripirellula sp.]